LLLDETTTGRAPIAAKATDDRSMALFEYALAIVAVAAAFLLAIVR
jgi:hypothetical protein